MHSDEAASITENVWKPHNKMLCNASNTADDAEHGGKSDTAVGRRGVRGYGEV